MEAWAEQFIEELGFDFFVYAIAEYDPIKYEKLLEQCTYTEIASAYVAKVAASSFRYEGD